LNTVDILATRIGGDMLTFRRLSLLIIILLTVEYETGIAQSEATAEFLLIKPGGKANAMGGANVALASDFWGTYYNPGAVGFTKSFSAGIYMSDEISAIYGADYIYTGAVFRVPSIGVFGASFTYFDLGEQAWTDENGNNIGQFESYNAAFSILYARKFSEKLAIGASLKYIRMKFGAPNIGTIDIDGLGTSIAVDIGVLYKNVLPGLTFAPENIPGTFLSGIKPERFSRGISFGLTIKNIGNRIKFADAAQADPIPTTLVAGLSYTPVEIGNLLSVRCTFDISKFLVNTGFSGADSTWRADPWYKAVFTSWDDGFDEIMYGAEIDFLNIFALRAGRHLQDHGLDYKTFGMRIGGEFLSMNIWSHFLPGN
ncbi:PorV/PorQ family protein, partial [candidate division KSB1 bacterium]